MFRVLTKGHIIYCKRESLQRRSENNALQVSGFPNRLRKPGAEKDFSFQRPGFGKITMPGSSSAGGILSGSTVTGGEPERMAAAADGRKNVKKSYIMEEKEEVLPCYH